MILEPQESARPQLFQCCLALVRLQRQFPAYCRRRKSGKKCLMPLEIYFAEPSDDTSGTKKEEEGA
jgi:hypothetical protein